MSASLALGCCLAVWSAGPNVSLSQPRVHQARPAAAVVIPVGHVVWVEDRESILNMHATPELPFAERDLLQIEFEFSQPESCHDSHVFQPAPPAESETAAPVHPVPMHVTPAWRLRMPTLDIQPAAACDEPVSAQPPAELSDASDRLDHLKQAMQHLHAAGMPELANQVADTYAASLEQRRQQLEFELQQTTHELHRLSHEWAPRDDERSSLSSGHPFDRLRLFGPAVPPPPAPGFEVAPSSNVVPFPPEPMSAVPAQRQSPTPRNLINPSFYIGEAPPRVVEAWQRAFTPTTAAAPATSAAPRVVFPTPGTTDRPRLLLQITPFPNATPPTPEPEYELPPAPMPGVQIEADSDPVA